MQQPSNVVGVLNALEIAAEDSASSLYDIVDLQRIGVGGHSLGAITSLGLVDQSCCVDQRVTAVVLVSLGDKPFTKSDAIGRSVPTLFVHGSADETFGIRTATSIFDRIDSDRYFVTLHGAPHTPFRGTFSDTVEDSVTRFLDSALKQRPGGRERLLDLGDRDNVDVTTG